MRSNTGRRWRGFGQFIRTTFAVSQSPIDVLSDQQMAHLDRFYSEWPESPGPLFRDVTGSDGAGAATRRSGNALQAADP
jgi:hypothetical protein